MSTRGRRDPTLSVVEHFERLSASGDWTRLYEIADGRTYHFHVRRACVLELLPSRLGHVVDVGCGPGVMAAAMLDRGGTFEGVDLSPAMILEATRRFDGVDRVKFRVGDIESLDLPDSSCDEVLCMGVLEYLTSPDRAVSEIARILRPGGLAIITVPKRRHIDQLTVAFTAPVRAVGRALGLGDTDRLPRLRFQPAELDAVAAEAGLERDGGIEYHFTLLPYPLTRLTPKLCMRLNMRFEQWRRRRSVPPSFFAHGYVGRYRKI